MALSVIDIYRDFLPKTNCGDCGKPSCMAFATLVVVEKYPIRNCPHIDPQKRKIVELKLSEQHEQGKWVKKDVAADALQWARERSASVEIKDLPARIGGELMSDSKGRYLLIPYFTEKIIIRPDIVTRSGGEPLGHYEQVFIFNHMSQGGSRGPTGRWKAFEEIPNTISKIKSMKDHVEVPIVARYKNRPGELAARSVKLGGVPSNEEAVDTTVMFRPLPRIPIKLLFWDEDLDEGFDAKVKLLFDETIVEHLDIESIMFLCERLRQLLCED